MTQAREPLRRVIIVGSGQVGTLTAIALKRALPACEVIVIGSPTAPEALADNAVTALPFTNKLHNRLGISEEQIIVQAGGSHRLVTRYFGWAGPASHAAMSYGAPSDPAMQTGFARDWGGGAKSSASGPELQKSVAETLADAGRFAPPPTTQETPLSSVEYALRWNGAAYRQVLILAAQKLGVRHAEGPIGSVNLGEDGAVASLSIQDGGEISADLFVDCGGPGAPLLSQLPGYSAIDWSVYLPIRRLHYAKAGNPMLALEDRVTLLPEGTLCEHAGRDGLQAVLATPSANDDDAIARALGSVPALSVTLNPARASAPWIGNVVAIGDAAAQVEPLAGLPLDLAHRQLALLLELLPGRQIEPLERAEYNRRSGLMMDGVRDCLAMHYASPHAIAFSGCQRPETVERAIDQFTRRGRMPLHEESAFTGAEIMGLLSATGHMPGTQPQFLAMDDHQIEAIKQRAANECKAALEFAPPYQQWMAQALKPRT